MTLAFLPAQTLAALALVFAFVLALVFVLSALVTVAMGIDTKFNLDARDRHVNLHAGSHIHVTPAVMEFVSAPTHFHVYINVPWVDDDGAWNMQVYVHDRAMVANWRRLNYDFRPRHFDVGVHTIDRAEAGFAVDVRAWQVADVPRSSCTRFKAEPWLGIEWMIVRTFEVAKLKLLSARVGCLVAQDHIDGDGVMAIVRVLRSLVAVGDRVGDKDQVSLVFAIEGLVLLVNRVRVNMRHLDVAKASFGFYRERVAAVVTVRLVFALAVRVGESQPGKGECEKYRKDPVYGLGHGTRVASCPR